MTICRQNGRFSEEGWGHYSMVAIYKLVCYIQDCELCTIACQVFGRVTGLRCDCMLLLVVA